MRAGLGMSGFPGGISATPLWHCESNVADAELGSDLSTAGDINGDGFADAIFGAKYYTNGDGFPEVITGAPGLVLPGTRGRKPISVDSTPPRRWSRSPAAPPARSR